MALTRVERERIQDSKLKIQSIADTLQHVGPGKVEHLDDLKDCLEDADRTLDDALKSDRL